MDEIKPGNIVRWFCPYGYYVYGEVTLIKDDHAKVLFEYGDWNYDYYRISELEKVTAKELADDINERKLND